MDIENDDDDFGGFDLVKKGAIKMKISDRAMEQVREMTKQAKTTALLNEHLDPKNQARTSFPTLKCQNIEFESFLMKNKYKNQRGQVFDALREKLHELGFDDVKKVSDKLGVQIMVIRIIQKVQNTLNDFLIEDEFSQEKMQVKEGTIWVGMICAVEVEYADGIYRLKRVIDFSSEIEKTKPRLMMNMSAYRIMMVKGPFRPNLNNEDKGISIITNYLYQLKAKQRVYINCLIVMGPLLSKNHRSVKQFTLETRFEDEYEQIVKMLKSEVTKILPEIQILILPSLDDIVSIHPIPQPNYIPENRQQKVRYLSNPCSVTLQGKTDFKIDLINYDILKFIDTFRGGKATKQIRQQNFQTYLKQPFLMTNTRDSEEPFDEINIPALYNAGNFGQLIVISSKFSPPYINKVDGRIIFNIGSLSVDMNETGSHYLSIVSLYEGEGLGSERLKIETITM